MNTRKLIIKLGIHITILQNAQLISYNGTEIWCCVKMPCTVQSTMTTWWKRTQKFIYFKWNIFNFFFFFLYHQLVFIPVSLPRVITYNTCIHPPKLPATYDFFLRCTFFLISCRWHLASHHKYTWENTSVMCPKEFGNISVHYLECHRLKMSKW